MRSLSGILWTIFMVMFWIFRIIVTISVQDGTTGDFAGFIVFDNTIEIVMLFVSLLCFILIFKGMVWGSIIYLAGYGWYFGKYIVSTAIPVLTSGEAATDIGVIQNTVIAVFGIILGIVVTLSIIFEKKTSKHDSNNKTNWFFDNKDYERKIDDKADKNQYRTL